LQIFERTQRVKEGIIFLLSHFEGRQPLFPRKMSTSLSNGRQFIVYNQEQFLNECIKANFIDCRINAYPVQMDSGLLQSPNVIFIDIDLVPFNKVYHEDLEKLNKTLNKILRNIESRLDGFKPTVLWTGNGYHIYITVDTRPLELIVELNQMSKNPSEHFLRFSEMKLSAKAGDLVYYYKSDNQNGVSLNPQDISVRKYKVMLWQGVKDILEIMNCDLNTIEQELGLENKIRSTVPVGNKKVGEPSM
jgi:hypothetical protein